MTKPKSDLGTEGGGIHHPVFANRFAIQLELGDSQHLDIRLQTIKVDCDFHTKDLNMVIEVPRGSPELLNDLIELSGTDHTLNDGRFCSSETPVIIIDYLDGESLVPDQTLRCVLDRVTSCYLSHDYASSDTLKVYFNCKVGEFLAVKPASEE